ncbi:chitosanase [Streptomyces sp. CRN 30]|uniref:chitosanase n=1 Tax=Streptomyces sp. CRN 30 TaxID=3075613 RepID=UPI002A7FCBF9|nr:chitosanase [Streptomyces sp. CRN 30]
MKRAGCLLLAAAPVAITAAVYLLTPGSSDTDAPGDRAAASAPAQGAGDAKVRAEDEGTAEDEAIADAPPGLAAPDKKELAHQLVATARDSTTDWRTTYGIVEDVGDGRGYTAGIVGFCTGTHDLLALVERYTESHPDNGLARYLPALREVDGTDSHEGLDPGFTAAWQAESRLPAFQEAQEAERDDVYFDPAVRLAKLDGLGTLGQFVYYDAMVLHGPGTDADSFYGLRERALEEAELPARGGDEKAFLDAFLDVRRETMRTETASRDTSRIDTAQRRFLQAGNMDLSTPLTWGMYGETYQVP